MTRIKRLAGVILVVAVFILVVANIIHDFVANDTIRYYSEQPHQLLLVAVIGIACGFILFGFSVLPLRLQRWVKLVVLGSVASFVLLGGGYLSFQVANLPALANPTNPRQIPWLLVLGTIVVAGLLWFEFYQVLRSRTARSN